MMDWKPIDTAPKDGTVIRIRDRQGEVLAAFWNKDKKDYPWYYLDPGAQDMDHEWAITHVNGVMANQIVEWKPLED